MNRIDARTLSTPLDVPDSITPLFISGDAKFAKDYISNGIVDVIFTSPPYWQKRDYGHKNQIGIESTKEEFIENLANIVDSWESILARHGSIYVNLGDSYRNNFQQGIPLYFELAMRQRGWNVISNFIWAKKSGLPDPHNRLPQRHESIIQITKNKRFFIDKFAYTQRFRLSDGNVWHIEPRPSKKKHLAPFPEELVERAILLSCPEKVCSKCGTAIKRETRRRLKLNMDRPQARRALEIWKTSGLTDEHLDAIRATGNADTGKSKIIQKGKNATRTQLLAEEAKQKLNGYFREFTFAQLEDLGFKSCSTCGSGETRSGLILDPFAGTGTTLKVAEALNRYSIGIDLNPSIEA